MNKFSPHCLNCNTKLTGTLINLGKTPIANNFSKKKVLKKLYKLHAQVCEMCFLVQVNSVVKPKEFFNEYSYQSGQSSSWLRHCRNISKKIKLFKIKKDDLILEIGSNDGSQLNILKNEGFKNIYGVDPSRNLSKLNKKKGLKIFTDFFGSKFAKKFISTVGKPKIIIANNVIAHIPNINDFCFSLNKIIDDSGICIVEFHYLIELIKKNAFDTIYHEHHFYHSLFTINKILLNNDLKIFNFEKIDTHGGSLRIYIAKYSNSKININKTVYQQLKYELDLGINDIKFYNLFNTKIKKYKNNFLGSFKKIIDKKKKIYGYGAAAKSCTFIHFMKIQKFILGVYDKNEYKQKRFIPNTKIEILSPNRILKDKPDIIVVFIWNLKKEIINDLKIIKKWGGKLIFCLPSFQKV